MSTYSNSRSARMNPTTFNPSFGGAESNTPNTHSVYVSITGLKLKHPIYAPLFWWLAIQSMKEAKSSEGCHEASSQTVNGVHHTLSVWRDRAAMRSYLTGPSHRKAMNAFTKIATGKTLGFASDKAPDWSEVHLLWHERGREVWSRPNEGSE